MPASAEAVDDSNRDAQLGVYREEQKTYRGSTIAEFRQVQEKE